MWQWHAKNMFDQLKRMNLDKFVHGRTHQSVGVTTSKTTKRIGEKSKKS